MSARRAAGLVAATAATLVLAGTGPGSGAAATGSPAVLEITTVPRVSGMTFKLDGRRFASRGDGVARIEYDGGAPLRDRLEAVPTKTRPGVKAALGRWYGNLDRPGQTKLTAALGLSYAVKLSFTNLRGKAVAESRVSSVTIRSSNGIVTEIEGKKLRERQWFQGLRTVSTPTGPAGKDILLSVERVVVDGANVVNRSQQRFLPRRQRDVEIAVLFYSARFLARDALLKIPLGSGVRLLHPDGRWTYHEFGTSSEIVVDGLARGEYSVEVDGPGISFLRPVTLTRDQVVELEVLSYLDMGLTFGILVAIALGLLYIGRPHLFSPLRPRPLAGLRTRQAAWRGTRPEERTVVDDGANANIRHTANTSESDCDGDGDVERDSSTSRTPLTGRASIDPRLEVTALEDSIKLLNEELDDLVQVFSPRPRSRNGMAEVPGVSDSPFVGGHRPAGDGHVSGDLSIGIEATAYNGTIRHRRRELGLTQRQVAEMAGVSNGIVGQLERSGQAKLTPAARKVLAVLGLGNGASPPEAEKLHGTSRIEHSVKAELTAALEHLARMSGSTEARSGRPGERR